MVVAERTTMSVFHVQILVGTAQDHQGCGASNVSCAVPHNPANCEGAVNLCWSSLLCRRWTAGLAGGGHLS